MDCSVCLQTLSAEGSIDEHEMRKSWILCDARFLALCNGIRIVGMRDCGLGMTKGKDPAANRKGERALPCAAAHTKHSRRDVD